MRVFLKMSSAIELRLGAFSVSVDIFLAARGPQRARLESVQAGENPHSYYPYSPPLASVTTASAESTLACSRDNSARGPSALSSAAA